MKYNSNFTNRFSDDHIRQYALETALNFYPVTRLLLTDFHSKLFAVMNSIYKFPTLDKVYLNKKVYPCNLKLAGHPIIIDTNVRDLGNDFTPIFLVTTACMRIHYHEYNRAENDYYPTEMYIDKTEKIIINYDASDKTYKEVDTENRYLADSNFNIVFGTVYQQYLKPKMSSKKFNELFAHNYILDATFAAAGGANAGIWHDRINPVCVNINHKKRPLVLDSQATLMYLWLADEFTEQLNFLGYGDRAWTNIAKRPVVPIAARPGFDLVTQVVNGGYRPSNQDLVKTVPALDKEFMTSSLMPNLSYVIVPTFATYLPSQLDEELDDGFQSMGTLN
jgi:hypothetical protein